MLGLLVRTPDKLSGLQTWLTDQGMSPLAEADFSAADNQALLKALTGYPVPEDALTSHLAYIERHLAQRPPLPDDTVLREAQLTLMRLREQQRKQELTQLEYLLADAKGEGDTASASRYAVRVQHVSLDLERIRRALTQTLRSPVPTR
jgi:hypothetical protein